MRTAILLLVAGGLTACTHRAALRADEFLPLAAGRTWNYQSREGARVTRLACVREGGDVRTLDGHDGVEFAFVFATPEGFDAPTAKSIWALPRDGPRLAFLDAWLWSLEFDPPIALLPPGVRCGDAWSWTGSARLDRESLGPLRMTVLPPAELATAAGTFQAIVVQASSPDTGMRVNWWLAAGIGVLRVDVASGADPIARTFELESFGVP